jgi:hypothetical protein
VVVNSDGKYFNSLHLENIRPAETMSFCEFLISFNNGGFSQWLNIKAGITK